MSSRNIRPKVGDVFAIRLRDGTIGVGHVVAYEGRRSACALFAKRAHEYMGLLSELDMSLAQPLTILTITDARLRRGDWPIFSHRIIDYSNHAIPSDGRGTSHTSDIIEDFLEAYHGLTPWDGMYEPDYFQKKLIPGVPVPPTVRYKRDFAPSAQSAPTAQPEPAPQVTEGPAEIHIAILYPGKGLPTGEQLHKRQELERRLEEENAGEITDAGGGEGVMDIYLETDDVQRAMPIVERLVSELGLAADTLIEAGPVDEDGVDEDEEKDEEEEDDDE